ncbi:MAG TPA: ankyrin repeat domain-containing protein [Candidatus Adamsella sp.]|nr:ankyrin repeat domain-containing protein [Candidatus Adamsella sp.]
MNISRINSIGFKYNTQLSSAPKKHSYQPVQTQTQPALTPSLEQMHQFVNLSFGKKEQKEAIFSAIREYDMEYLKQLENKNPKAFAKLISTPEDPQTGYTPVHTAVSMNNTEALKFIAETAPDEFKKTLDMKARNTLSPIYLAVSRDNPESLRIIRDTAPEIFSKEIFTEGLDAYGSTLVHKAIDDKNNKALKFIVESNPDEFKELLIKNKAKSTSPIFYAADRDNTEALQIIKDAEPEIFSEAVTDKYEYDRTLVHITADSTLRKNALKFLAEKTPQEFAKALTMQDGYGYGVTPVHIAVKENNTRALEIMAKTAPEEFKQTLLKQYESLGYPKKPHDNPVIKAVKNYNFEALKIFAEAAPQEFLDIFKNFEKPE